MRKTLIGAVALIALGTGVAGAADMPVKAPPSPLPPPFSWTGFYIGGNIGAAWAQRDVTDTLFGLDFSNGGTKGRFIGGGQLGFNYQIGYFVIGAEGDFDAAASDNNNNITVVGPRGHSIQVVSNDNNNSVLTAAARFGFAVDHLLFYGKAGGGLVGKNSYSVNDLTSNTFFATTSASNTRSGWLLGGGLEWAVTNNWTVKFEYDYLGLTSQSFTVPGTAIPVLAGDTFNFGNNNIQMVKLGINYLFPVTASY